ncbi:fructosamine kinase family protein [Endothiovibrio diazotrophicus]
MELWRAIGEAIGEATGEPFEAARHHAVGGGCINATYVVGDGRREFFVKLNRGVLVEMFAAEAEGLAEIVASASIRAPAPVCWGEAAGQGYLVLERLELGGGGAAERFGRELAAMHRTTRERFGWHRDNTIGSTPQINAWHPDWLVFYRERRLAFQFELAARNGFPQLRRKGEPLMERLADLFPGYAPVPSLLHGDLWGGNHAVARGGEPVIFDPAVYYGDREADLAMTELFGTLPAAFYAAYNEAWPLDAGYPVRRTLYNLYHILNHANLFGGGYAGQAESMIGRLLSEVR